MSGSNPFHRNSRPAGNETTNPGLRNDRPNADNGLPSLKVEVPRATSTPKRVRIASPPVPVSPVTPASYSSSPEVARYSNLPGSPLSTESENIPYAQALASNPFQSSLSDGESEEVDEELLENTRRNTTLGSKEGISGGNGPSDSVKATLARFAGVPKRSTGTPALGTGDESLLSSSKSSRSTLDLDAFKRLLLTGESGVPTDQAKPAATHTLPHPAVVSDSSSSNADTASVSQQSLFESLAPVITDTPRTSHEFDREEVGSEGVGERNAKATSDRKPPVPKPRHGIPLSDKSPIPATYASLRSTRANQITTSPVSEGAPSIASPSDLNKPLPPPPIDNTFPPVSETGRPLVSDADAALRKPPAPPLSRRRSQHKNQSFQESYNASSRLQSALTTSATTSPDHESSTVTSKGPPPPPSRRKKRGSDIDLQSSEAIAHEENDSEITSTQPPLSPSSSMASFAQPKPQPPPSRNPSAAKRLSRTSTASPATSVAPPLPPPRRVRGSSRSSFDSQAAVIPQDSEIGARRQSDTDSSRNVSGQSMSNNILADLAALQMEVDALRDKQERGTGNAK